MSSTALLLSPAFYSLEQCKAMARMAVHSLFQGLYRALLIAAGRTDLTRRPVIWLILAANLGELSEHCPLQEAMAFAHEGLFSVTPRFTQALAWEIITREDITIIDKNGGLKNTSTYVEFVPQKKIEVVILSNRGKTATRVGREILYRFRCFIKVEQ